MPQESARQKNNQNGGDKGRRDIALGHGTNRHTHPEQSDAAMKQHSTALRGGRIAMIRNTLPKISASAAEMPNSNGIYDEEAGAP